MKSVLFTLALLFYFSAVHAQDDKPLTYGHGNSWGCPNPRCQQVHCTSGTRNHMEMWFAWGYNRSQYTTSNIHIYGPGYDFWLWDLAAHDRPTRFDPVLYFSPATISIPQYNWQFGLTLANGLSMTVGMDHMKYVVDRVQPTRISGNISAAASPAWEGSYDMESILLDPDLLMLEHTDGLNYASFGLLYIPTLVTLGKKARPVLEVQPVLGADAGFVIPRSDVRVFGDGLNNDFHIAGYGYAGIAGIKLQFLNRFFVQAQVKGGYMTLPAVLIKNNEVDLAQQNFGFLEQTLMAGVSWRVGGR